MFLPRFLRGRMRSLSRRGAQQGGATSCARPRRSGGGKAGSTHPRIADGTKVLGTEFALSGPTRVISVTSQTDVPPEPVKVLFAEDEDLVRLMMDDVLRDAGFQVIEASDAAEAISIIKTTPVDAVITDLRMSAVADGLELAAYVRAHCPGVSLIGASAYAPPISEDLAFDAFFIKPYNPEDLASWIRHRHGSPRVDQAES
jgi:CheY-like chemotaxis protein